MTRVLNEPEGVAREPVPRHERIIWPALVAGIALLLFIVGSSTGIYLTPVRVLAVAVGAAALVVWLTAALVRPNIRPISGLLAALASAIAVLATSAAAAPVPRLALDYLAYAVLLAGLYLLLVRVWRSESLAPRLGMLCVILVAGMGALYVAAVVRRWIDTWSALGQVTAPTLRPGYEGLWFGNPNAFAPIVVLLFLAAVAQVGLKTAKWRLIFGALGVLVAVDVVLAGSRGAWLGLAVAVAVVGAAALLDAEARARLIRVLGQLRASRKARMVGAAAVFGIAIMGLLMGPALAARLVDQPGLTTETRTTYWAASIRMFENHPLTGVGPGAWAPDRLVYSSGSELDYPVPHAHNLPLHVLSELGLVGVLAAIVVVVGVARLVLRATSDTNGESRRVGWIAVFAIAFVLGQHLVDEYVHQPAVLFAIALPIAKLDAVTARSSRSARGGGRGVTLALLVAVVAAALIGLWVERVAATYDQAVAAADRGNWANAVVFGEAVVRDDPGLAPYRLMLGAALVQAGQLEQGQGELELAARLDDYPRSWLLLASVQEALGDSSSAISSLDRAMRLGWQDPAVAVPASELYARLGRGQEAIHALADAIALAPSLASDPYWRDGERAERLAAAVADVVASAPPDVAVLVAIERRDDATAIDRAAQVDGTYGEALALAAHSIAGDDTAFVLLQELARAHPTDQEVASVCVRTAELTGRIDTDGLPRCPGVRLRGSSVVAVGIPTHRETLPGADAPFHGIYGYRRTLPANLVPPWLPNLIVLRPE